EQVARWLKRIREPFLFGLDPEETPDFLGARKLDTVSDYGPDDLARAYLTSKDGRCIGKTFGHLRIVHARTLGATPPTAAPLANEHCASASPVEPREDNEACEEREDRHANAVPTAPMLGGLIYEAVMERNSTRALNDALRQTFIGGRVVVSPGVLSLPPLAHT